MSGTTISALPDLPLRNIFKRLSLTDQIYGVRLVCVGWRALLQTELDRRRTLVLTHDDENQNESLNALGEDKLHCHDMFQHVLKDDGSPMVRLPTLEQIKYDYVPLRIAVRKPTLMNALPGLTNLTVAFKKISPAFLRKIICMLYHWSDTLVSLTLDLEKIIGFKEHNDVTLLSMFEAIDQLQSLRHLKFNLTRADCRDDFVTYFPEPKLKIVSRLSTLCVARGIYPEWFFSALNDDGNRNENLLEICYHFDILACGHDVLEEDLKHPRVVNCFTALYTSELQCSIWNEQSSERMQRLCTQFGTLTTLTLPIEPSALFGLAAHLARLQHLVTLQLNISRYEDEWNRARPGLDDGWPILNFQNPTQLNQVGSVRFLDLFLNTISHENIAALQFPVIFPNTQVVRLLHHSRRCSICQYDYMPRDAPNSEMQNKISECMRLARESFKNCAYLHTIEYNQDPSCFPSPSMRLISPPEW